MSCGDGSGHQLDTGFGAGWSNNLNEGTVLKTRILLVNGNHDRSKTAERKTFGENTGNIYGP